MTCSVWHEEQYVVVACAVPDCSYDAPRRASQTWCLRVGLVDTEAMCDGYTHCGLARFVMDLSNQTVPRLVPLTAAVEQSRCKGC